jgi:hypothetical protein
LAFTVLFDGQVIVGNTVSLTVTVNEHCAVLPYTSSAVYVIVVTPTLKVFDPTKLMPHDGESPVVAPVMHQVNDTQLQLSLNVGFGTVIRLLQLLLLMVYRMLAGQLTTGGWLSSTVTVKQQLLVRPDASLTV